MARFVEVRLLMSVANGLSNTDIHNMKWQGMVDGDMETLEVLDVFVKNDTGPQGYG